LARLLEAKLQDIENKHVVTRSHLATPQKKLARFLFGSRDGSMSICQAMTRKPTHQRTPRFLPIWRTWPARGRRAFACNPTDHIPGSTPTTYSGSVDIVDRANSPYGAGWSLDNVEQLVSVSGGMMLVNPDGTSLYFASNGSGGYITPAGDFSTLTLTSGVYTRTLTDGTQINFNSSGQETSTVDRDGNTTTFGYTNGLLTSITDMNGQVTTLAYNSSNLLSTITDPASRTATLTYTGAQLTGITDPGSNLWTYGYDTGNDLTSLTDPNTHPTSFTYNFADRVSSITQPDNTTESLIAEQMNGLAAPGTGTSGNPAPAVLLATGDQAQFTDGNNNVWTTGLDWLGFGLAVDSIDPLGDTSLTYIDNNGLAWMSTDALGRRTRNFFDSKGNTTESVAADDTVQLYQYNQFAEVTQYTDQENNITAYTYNTKGDLTQTTDALNDITTYVENSVGLVTSTTDPNGNTTNYTYNSLNELTGVTNALNQTTTYAYTTAGQLSSTTDALGFTTTYNYNAYNQLIGKTLPDTPGVFSTYNYTYDKVGNELSSTDPLNHTTNYTYNAVNEMTSSTNALGYTTTYGYNPVGEEISSSNPLNDTTVYGYNAANELTSVTDPMGNITAYTYDAAGEKTSVTDPMGIYTEYTYTLRGQLADTYIGGNGVLSAGAIKPYTQIQHSVQLEGSNGYGPCGCLQSTTLYQVSITAPPPPSGAIQPLGGSGSSGQSTSYQEDALNRITGVTDAMGNTTTYGYDKNSNRTSVTDANGNTTTYAYNALNQLTGVTNPLNQTTTYGYNAVGEQTSVTDALGNATTYTFDGQGRILTATAPNGGVTTYKYDLAGNLLSLTDPDGNVTSYTYNSANELVSTTNPLGYVESDTYNSAGELTSTTDYNGNTIDYAYNADGLETSETWVNGNYTATFAYNADKQLTSASDPFSTYSYTYNQFGYLASVSNAGTPGVPTVTLSYNYDGYFNVAGMSDSLGGNISYSYNNNNQMTGLGLSLNGTLDAQVTLGYDGVGNLTTMTRTAPAANGDTISTSLSYDKANELSNITHIDSTTSTTLASYNYTYNVGNQLTGYRDNGGNSLTYSYDANGELTGASGTLAGSSYSGNWSYDLNGNRNMSGYSTGTGNQLLSDGINNYTYDKNGNTLTQTNIATGTVTNYSWDYANRLTEVKIVSSGGIVLNDEKFTYDMFGNRIGVSLNGSPTLYTVFNGSNPYMDFNGSGTLAERYLANPNALSQYYGQVNASGTVQWFLTDNLNSIRQVISANGVSLDAITYDPWGNIVGQTNSGNAPRILYAGGIADSLTGNVQFDARTYNPSDARWLEQDPLGFAARDANLYRYVSNDSMKATDPSGQAEFKIGGHIFYVHKNDPDPRPSDPHAHIGGPNSTTKVDINTGQIFKGTKATGRYIPRKVLTTLRQQMRGKGLLCAAFVMLLAAPEVVQAGQERGSAGAAQAAGGVVFDTAIGTGESAAVGMGIISAATAAGTTVTVSGTAVTSVAGATGVGGLVIVTAAGGYAVGNAIGEIHVGGQTVHDHIADGMIWGLNLVGLW
jgi:RHS repeat-associated protein